MAMLDPLTQTDVCAALQDARASVSWREITDPARCGGVFLWVKIARIGTKALKAGRKCGVLVLSDRFPLPLPIVAPEHVEAAECNKVST